MYIYSLFFFLLEFTARLNNFSHLKLIISLAKLDKSSAKSHNHTRVELDLSDMFFERGSGTCVAVR